MGANSSVFLNPELPADDETVCAFQEFENECISRNLKATEIYDLLNEKYDHLLGREMEKKMSQRSSLPPINPTTDAATQTMKIYKKVKKVTKTGKPIETSSLRSTSSGRHTLPPLKERTAKTLEDAKFPQPRKPSLPKPQVISKTFGTLTRPRLPALKSVSCDAADSSSRSTPCTIDVSRSDSSDSMTVTDCYDANLHSFSLDDMDMDHLTDDEAASPTIAEPTVSTATAVCPEVSQQGRRSSTSITDTMCHFECRLCKKKFGSAELLETHIAFSQTHKEAIKRVREKYARAFRDADRVGSLLRKSTERFQRVLETKKGFLEGKISAEKMQWQRAIGKVISQFTAKQIEKIMQELQEEEDYAKAAVAAADASAAQAGALMFSSSRFFWRTKSRFNVYVMYHKHSHCLEVISVLMPEKSGPEETAKLAPRIFLSMDLLERQYELLHIESEAVHVTAPTAAVVMSAEDTGITRAMRIVRDVVQSLKIDYSAVQAGQKLAEEAIYFDDSMSSMHQLPSPLFAEQPKALILTPSDTFLRVDADEAMVQSKLQELSQAQRMLSEAVDKAESMAMKINYRDSPRQRPLLLSPLAASAMAKMKAVFSPKSAHMNSSMTANNARPFPAQFSFDQV